MNSLRSFINLVTPRALELKHECRQQSQAPGRLPQQLFFPLERMGKSKAVSKIKQGEAENVTGRLNGKTVNCLTIGHSVTELHSSE